MANVEIERKFLVNPKEFTAIDLQNGVRIKQGYLAIEPNGTEVRLREKGTAHTLTVKSSGELVRAEKEIELSAVQFSQLWPLTEGRQLDKYRYTVELGEVTAEVDRYLGRLSGLVTVEVEFENEAQAAAFEVPEWFGTDVTAHGVFKNRHLAEHGIAFGDAVMRDGTNVHIPTITLDV